VTSFGIKPIEFKLIRFKLALKNIFNSLSYCVQMTGIELNEKLALFYAEYKATDHLLCHDDELEGRRIAFILYLSPQWSEEDGGTLDLFSVDDQVKRRNILYY
jgi:Rps23 Pro-64 3,4-dihydroxylase Tpa1-like proline 4-hydroxylase